MQEMIDEAARRGIEVWQLQEELEKAKLNESSDEEGEQE